MAIHQDAVYGAWARAYGWLQDSPGFSIWGMGQGQWMAPAFSRIKYMGHGPGSMDGSRVHQDAVHGAVARVHGWLQNVPGCSAWGSGQGPWVAPECSRMQCMGQWPGSMGGSRMFQDAVHGAVARVHGWLQNVPGCSAWGSGQGPWVAP